MSTHTTQAIIVSGFGDGTIQAAADFEEEKRKALDAAKAIKQTVTQEEIMLAVKAKRDLAELRIYVNKRHKEAKRPFIQWGKEVDQVAEKLVLEIEPAEKRLESMINARQKEIMDEQRKATEEAQRKQREAEAEAKAAQDRIAELERQAQEARQREEAAKRQAEQAKTEKAKQAALQEAELARQAQDAAQQQQFEAELAAESAVSTPTAVVPVIEVKGVNAREVKSFRVIGDNIYKKKASLILLAQKYPHLVNIEPRTRDIQTVINEQGIEELPGLEIFSDVKTSIR